MRVRQTTRRKIYVFSTAVVILALGLFFLAPDFLDTLEAKFYDLHFKLRGARHPGDQVVIVAIDEKSLAAVGRWPWSRSVMADLVRKLGRAGAKVVALDILLSEPEVSGERRAATVLSERLRTLGPLTAGAAGQAVQGEVERLLQQYDHDALLERAIQENARVVLPVVFEVESETASKVSGAPPEPAGQPLKSNLVSFRHYGERGLYPPPSASGATLPIPAFAAAARELGHVTMLADPDGSTRWEALVFQSRGYYYPSLGLQAVRVASDVDSSALKLDFGRAVEVGPRVVPVDPRNRMLVDYAGPARTFPHFSAVDVLTGKVPIDALRSRIVFIGATAAGTYDLRVTPMSPIFPGVEKHATVAANILGGRFLQRPDWMPLVEALGIVFWPTFLAWLLPRLRPAMSIGSVAVLWGLSFGVVHLAFRQGLWVPLVYPSLAMVVSPIVITGYLYFAEDRQRRWVKQAFKQFVSAEVVDRILEDPSTLRFGGELRTLTVMFTDIRDFTGYTERHPPDEVVRILREYLTQMSDQVLRHQGTLDKYIGDAIMAIFGAPVSQPDHAERACRAARGMVAELEKLHAKWKAEGREPFRMGIGINTAPMVVGNLGSEQLFDYTVVGDGVNLGARLESLTKEFATPVIISGETYEAVKHAFSARFLGEVKVKGKAIPVKIYALEHEAKRRAARAQVEAPLTITQGDVLVPAFIADISLSGVAVKQVGRRIPKDQIVQLRFELDGLPRPVSLEGRVVRSEEDGLGIMFLDVPAEEQKLLQAFLEAPDRSLAARPTPVGPTGTPGKSGS